MSTKLSMNRWREMFYYWMSGYGKLNKVPINFCTKISVEGIFTHSCEIWMFLCLKNEQLQSLAEESQMLKDEMDVLRHSQEKVVCSGLLRASLQELYNICNFILNDFPKIKSKGTCISMLKKCLTSVPSFAFARKHYGPFHVPIWENLWTPVERGSYTTLAVLLILRPFFQCPWIFPNLFASWAQPCLNLFYFMILELVCFSFLSFKNSLIKFTFSFYQIKYESTIELYKKKLGKDYTTIYCCFSAFIKL